jgi:hypothetical protein
MITAKAERIISVRVLETLSPWRLAMPTSLQYPVDRSRSLQQRWARLLQRTAVTAPSAKESHEWALVIKTMPPRDPNDDDDDEEEDEPDADREPAVVREPDEDD